MKPRIIEQIQRRLRREHPIPEAPSDEASAMPQSRRERMREWMAELSEDLANIDRTGKDDGTRHH